MKIIEVSLYNSESKIAIVISRFNNFINQNLLNGTVDVLKRIGQVLDENITVIWVPGMYEISLTVHHLIKSNKYDAIVILGTLIRGGTDQYKYIADATNNRIANLNNDIPVAFGILITDSTEQAIERAGAKLGNKGAEAGLAILEMINIIKAIQI